MPNVQGMKNHTDYGERICPVCGKRFEANYAAHVVCSVECKKTRRSEQKFRYESKRNRCRNSFDMEWINCAYEKLLQTFRCSTEEVRSAFNGIKGELDDTKAALEKERESNAIAAEKLFRDVKVLEERIADKDTEIANLSARLEESEKHVAELKEAPQPVNPNPIQAEKQETELPRKKYMCVCSGCGKSFKSEDRYDKYCSTQCKRDHAIDKNKKAKEKHITSVYQEFSRKCHDCGTPTNDYRCSKCNAEFRRKHGVPMSGINDDVD